MSLLSPERSQALYEVSSSYHQLEIDYLLRYIEEPNLDAFGAALFISTAERFGDIEGYRFSRMYLDGIGLARGMPFSTDGQVVLEATKYVNDIAGISKFWRFTDPKTKQLSEEVAVIEVPDSQIIAASIPRMREVIADLEQELKDTL